jgi:hypothetical protein
VHAVNLVVAHWRATQHCRHACLQTLYPSVLLSSQLWLLLLLCVMLRCCPLTSFTGWRWAKPMLLSTMSR